MYEMKLEDMTCGHCKARVTQTLKTLDPNARIEIDLLRRQVRVESAQELSEITEALAEAGYPASQVTTINTAGTDIQTSIEETRR